MIIGDATLARRVEAHEAWSASSHAAAQAALYRDTGATTLELASGGFAVFCGPRSPNSAVYGAGMDGPVGGGDVERWERFYKERDQKEIRVWVCPLADPSLTTVLGERGYVLRDFMNVYARPVNPLLADDRHRFVGEVRPATADEARRWFEGAMAYRDWADPDGVSFMTVRTARKAGSTLYLAFLEGVPVAAGAIEIHDGVASLMAAETLSEYRNRGAQTALLRARLEAAAQAGCDVAAVQTTPGTASQRNVLRAGFLLVYAAARLGRRLSV